MANVGPLTAEIGSVVWGTPANFNEFRVLAALLHGTLVVGVSQTAALTEGATYIGQAAITLGIGPHSSCQFISRAIRVPGVIPRNSPSYCSLWSLAVVIE